MTYNRLNNPIYWERRPVRLAELRDELKTYQAMGNQTAARITQHEIEAFERQVAASDEIHKRERRAIGFNTAPMAPLSSIDTQGR
jgi:biopolymer transport protein ExbD